MNARITPSTNVVAPDVTASKVVSTAVVAAVVSGVAAVADWLIQLRHVQSDSHWQGIDILIEVLFAVSLAATAVALTGFSRWLAVGRVGRIGAVVGQVGFALLFVSSVASAFAGENTLGALFPIGLLLALLGQLVLAVAGLIRSAHRWAAPLPFLGLLLSVAVAPFGGQLLVGLVWLALGFAMMTRAGRLAVA